MTTTPDLTELRRLAEAATPGPWESFLDCGEWQITTVEEDTEDEITVATSPDGNDGSFIAAANPAVVLWLLNELEGMTNLAKSLAQPEGEPCTAYMTHGPGHQSKTTCELRGPHEWHWAADPMCPGFEWQGEKGSAGI